MEEMCKILICFHFLWASAVLAWWVIGQCNHAGMCIGVTTPNKEQLILTPAVVVLKNGRSRIVYKNYNYFYYLQNYKTIYISLKLI